MTDEEISTSPDKPSPSEPPPQPRAPTPEEFKAAMEQCERELNEAFGYYSGALQEYLRDPLDGQVKINIFELLLETRLTQYRAHAIVQVMQQLGAPATIMVDKVLAQILNNATTELRKPRIAAPVAPLNHRRTS